LVKIQHCAATVKTIRHPFGVSYRAGQMKYICSGYLPEKIGVSPIQLLVNMLPSRRNTQASQVFLPLSDAGVFNLHETYNATLESVSISTLPDSDAEPAASPILEGYSDEYVKAAAEELEIALQIVADYADTIVICQRLGGAEMTLSQAVNTIWPPSEKGAMIKEGVASVVAEIQSMLANRPEKVEENEELEEESGTEELEEEQTAEAKEKPAEAKEDDRKNDDKNENPKAPERLVKADTEPQPIKRIVRNEHPSRPAGKAEKSSALRSADMKSVNAEAAISPSNVSKDIADAAGASLREAPAEPSISGTRGGHTMRLDGIGTSLNSGPEPMTDRAQIPSGQESESEPLVVDAERTYVLEETAASEVPPAAINDQPLALIDYLPEIDGPADFTEDAVPIEDFEVTNFEPDEPYVFVQAPVLEGEEYYLEPGEEVSVTRKNIEPRLPELMITGQERIIPANLAIEETEHILSQLSEQLTLSQPEAAEAVIEILDKIIEVPAGLKNDEGEIIIQDDAQAELEELFTELLNKIGIDYTPQLIESLARLSINWQLTEQIEKLEQEEPYRPPQGAGTHEIISKLLAALGAVKKAIARASTIGRSALRLYAFSLTA
jgi:hypothetical protein